MYILVHRVLFRCLYFVVYDKYVVFCVYNVDKMIQSLLVSLMAILQRNTNGSLTRQKYPSHVGIKE